MITRKGTAVIAVLLAISLWGSNLEAQRKNQKEAADEAAPPKVGPQASTQEELTAFDAIRNERSMSNRVTLSDSFLTTYPSSQLTGYIQRFRMEALKLLNKPKEAIAAGESALNFEINFLEELIKKADADTAAKEAGANTKDKRNNRNRNEPPPPAPLDKNSPEFQAFAQETERALMYYYQTLMDLYQQVNEATKVIEYAEKALGQDPEDLLSLLTISSVMAERPPAAAPDTKPNTVDKGVEAYMKRAEEYARKAMTKVDAFLSSPMGAQVQPEQKAGLQAQAHQTLGLIYLTLRKFGDSQKEYTAAIVAKKDDPVSYFRLGLAYAQDKKLEPALDSLAKSVYLKGITEAQAREILTQLYEGKNKSKEGLDQFIASAGQKIGQ